MSDIYTMDTAPRDGTTILAWHTVWKCWTTIRHRCIGDSFPWQDGTYCAFWKEESFSHWMKQPEAPKE